MSVRAGTVSLEDARSRIDIIKAITLVGFTSSVIFHYIVGSYAGFDYYPFNTFLFHPAERFKDFYHIYQATLDRNPYSVAVSVYLPFTFIPVILLTLLDNANIALFLFSFTFLTFLTVSVYKTVPFRDRLDRLMTTWILVFMSYPVLFNLDRGNLESLLFIFIALFVYYYKNGDTLKSVIFLSLAISMKVYPAVFCILFLSSRRYKEILYTAISVLVITILSSLALKGGVIDSFEGLKNNLIMFRIEYIDFNQGVHHNASLFGALEILFALFSDKNTILSYYTILAIALFCGFAVYIVMSEQVLWKNITLLVFSMILLPQVSFDYKLIHLFIPILLFINSDKRERAQIYYAICWGLLMIPKDYLFFWKDISIAVLINPVLMLMIIGKIFHDRFSAGAAQQA